MAALDDLSAANDLAGEILDKLHLLPPEQADEVRLTVTRALVAIAAEAVTAELPGLRSIASAGRSRAGMSVQRLLGRGRRGGE